MLLRTYQLIIGNERDQEFIIYSWYSFSLIKVKIVKNLQINNKFNYKNLTILSVYIILQKSYCNMFAQELTYM